jgi:CheY-like chemotaxis protein
MSSDRSERPARDPAAQPSPRVARSARDELLSLLSHDLRNPLNAILGWTRLLLQGALDESGTRHAIETIDRSARVQARLLDDTVEVWRMIAGELPLDVRPVDPPAITPMAIALPAELAGASVLAVDDDPDARALVARVLGECGARVETYGSVRGFLTAFGERPPDAIVSDIGMPDEDGYSLIKRVRRMQAAGGHKRTPAVAVTASAGVEDRVRALAAGFDVLVPKPVEPAELILVVAGLIAHARGG